MSETDELRRTAVTSGEEEDKEEKGQREGEKKADVKPECDLISLNSEIFTRNAIKT